MDRLLVGIIIAISALLLNGGLRGETMARELAGPPPAIATTASHPEAHGFRSETVLGLVLALEALRATPALPVPARP